MEDIYIEDKENESISIGIATYGMLLAAAYKFLYDFIEEMSEVEGMEEWVIRGKEIYQRIDFQINIEKNRGKG